jgi:hypothetical protein
MRVLLALTLLASGCTLSGLSPVADESGSDTGVGSDTGPSSPGAYDPYAGLAEDPACEDFDGTPYAGATGFFVGDYQVQGNILSGFEEWVLFANSTWESATPYPGWDCAIRWDVFGTINEPKDCVGCSHEIALDLTWNEPESTCQPALQEIEGPDGEGNVVYYVQALPDGTARFEFPSGTYIGTGILTGARAAWASEGQCAVF